MIDFSESPLTDGLRDYRKEWYFGPEEKGTTALWAAFAALVVALIAATGYGYYSLRADNIRLAKVSDLTNTIGPLSTQMEAADAQMRTGLGEWDKLVERVGKLETKVSDSL